MKSMNELAARFEQASISYAEANGITRNDDWFILKMQEELGELTQVWMKLTDRGRKRGQSDQELRQCLADETADLLGHILLFVQRNNIDLAPAITRKWRLIPKIFKPQVPLNFYSNRQVEYVFFRFCKRSWLPTEKCKTIVECNFTQWSTCHIYGLGRQAH